MLRYLCGGRHQTCDVVYCWLHFLIQKVNVCFFPNKYVKHVSSCDVMKFNLNLQVYVLSKSVCACQILLSLAEPDIHFFRCSIIALMKAC